MGVARGSLAGMIIHDKKKRAPLSVTWPRSAHCQASVSYAQVFIVLALRGLKATIIFVELNENVGKKRAAKMPHPNEIFGISISLLFDMARIGTANHKNMNLKEE